MADHDNPVHESPIRTPRQLITVIVLSFIIPIALAALLAKLASSEIGRAHV